MLPMQPSITISEAAHERLRHFREVHKLVTYGLRVHKDDMQAQSQASATPQLQALDKVSALTNDFCPRSQHNRKLKDKQLRPFTVFEKIGANSYMLPSIMRLYPVFSVDNLRTCPAATSRPFVPVTTHEDDDEYHLIDPISAVTTDIAQ
jgi:hypothetical protein